MTAVIRTKVTAHCRDCEWKPDPDRRKSITNQADEHTTEAKHTTVVRNTPTRDARMRA